MLTEWDMWNWAYVRRRLEDNGWMVEFIHFPGNNVCESLECVISKPDYVFYGWGEFESVLFMKVYNEHKEFIDAN